MNAHPHQDGDSNSQSKPDQDPTATAHPEPPDSSQAQTLPASRVEVTELFILRKRDAIDQERQRSQINITVTNCGDGWAAYSLWVACIIVKMTDELFAPEQSSNARSHTVH